jgi:hypothetical protein
MARYVNTARHPLTLPDGRTVGAGEDFETWDDLSDYHLAGHLLAVDDQPAAEPVTGDRVASQVPDDSALGEHTIQQGPPPDDETKRDDAKRERLEDTDNSTTQTTRQRRSTRRGKEG